MLSKAFSAVAQGVEAFAVEVEVDISNGLPKEQLVGLPDIAVKESMHRVRAALTNAGYFWPSNKRVTINLAPAEMRKEGPLYDLPMALGLLGASEQLNAEKLGDYLFVGELALDGRLRSVRGVLLFALLAKALGKRGIFVPPENGTEAAIVDGIDVYAPPGLPEAVAMLNGVSQLEPVKVDQAALFANVGLDNDFDLADVRGQEAVKRALTIAAAGGHNILLVGPPGSILFAML